MIPADGETVLEATTVLPLAGSTVRDRLMLLLCCVRQEVYAI